MPNEHKAELLETLERRFGKLTRLPNSQSLFVLGNGKARLYVRYSKVHAGGRTFFGLRDVDLRMLEGHQSFLCFLSDNDRAPLFIPYSDFEEVFRHAEPAADGQHKVQLLSSAESLELYVAKQGRFNVEGYVGYEVLQRFTSTTVHEHNELTHTQVQTLLAGIGRIKGHAIWVPDNNVGGLDWSLTERFALVRTLPSGYERVLPILQEVDVVWMNSGSNEIEALFEVEHSTPIYSGLLRFNDVLLTSPTLNRFTIVSNETRRDLFARQVRRPTFVKSGLSDITAFLEYSNVYDWHTRLAKQPTEVPLA